MSTTSLAAWAAESPRAHDATTTAAAIAGIRDAVGCMLAGSVEPEPRRVAAGIAGWGAGTCSLVGTVARAPAPWAALVNGTAAHVLDFDDTFAPLNGHAAAVLVPTILAIAEERDCSGAEVIDAFVVGMEILARIGAVVNPRHYALGWHATSTIGVIGAAAAAARLLRLDADGMTAAISLAVSMAAGTRMQLGAPAKSFHAGLAAKGGIVAATMAAAGMSGVSDALGGTWRFADIYNASPANEDEFVAPVPGETLAVVDPGINFKPYPTCAATHLTLDAILAMRAAHGFGADDVEAVETRVPAVNARNLMHPDPRTGMQARFSMQYPAAVAISSGAVTLRDFEPSALQRPAIRRLMSRITMTEISGSHGSAETHPTEVTILLSGGRRISQTGTTRRGSAAVPMTEVEHVAKFRDCAGIALPAAGVEHALERLNAMPSLRSVADLLAALRPADDRAAAN